MLLDFVKRQVKKAFRPSLSLALDNYALLLLRPFPFEYIPWTAAALRPSALCALLNEIIIHRRRMVVEFGAGVSTLYLGYVLRAQGGRLISFEHDAEWHASVLEMVHRYDLSETVNVVLAPLDDCPHAIEGCQWYSMKKVSEALAGLVVDGVVVDGPPASAPQLGMARFPAVPAVAGQLANSFFVFLHDIHRPGESCVFERWESLLQEDGTRHMIGGRFGLIRKGGGFATELYALD